MNVPRTPLLTVDCVVFSGESVLLITRRYPPFKGGLALPGGFVELEESVETACARELEEETGLLIEEERLRLVGVYSWPGRDPRGHTVSIAFAVTFTHLPILRASDDALEVGFYPLSRDLVLAFDHGEIIHDAVEICFKR